MSRILKKIPVPITGLMLGLAALGNLIQSYGEIYRSVFGAIAGVICILMLVKIVMYSKGVREALQNPVVAGVFPTFSMGIMILSTYLKPFSASIALGLWWIGLALQIILILWFTMKFVVKFNIKQVFPSWYVPFVGMAAASVTAPAHKMLNIGQAAFWFGLVTFAALFVVIIYRVVKVKEIPEPALPTLTILAAPASLLLAGYINSFKDKNMTLIATLAILSLATYLIVLFIVFTKLIRIKFYPSYSAFTFPLVISAMGMKLTNGFLVKSNQTISGMKYLVQVQEIIAVGFVLYVLIRYISFLFKKEVTQKHQGPIGL